MSPKDKEPDKVPVNDEMTIVEQWMQKQSHAADFVRSAFPDQMDGLEDPEALRDGENEK
ncbi:MAG: hypothetical protein K0S39_1363 [Paenibacillus sp.]|nr:hypothetical protein [Paenibacillus sp.]